MNPYDRAESAAREWNRYYPVGTPVMVLRPRYGGGMYRTRTRAWVANGLPTVLLYGRSEDFPLSSVREVSEKRFTAYTRYMRDGEQTYWLVRRVLEEVYPCDLLDLYLEYAAEGRKRCLS